MVWLSFKISSLLLFYAYRILCFCLVITLLQTPWSVVVKKDYMVVLMGKYFLQRNHFSATAFLFCFYFVMNKLNNFLPAARPLGYLQSSPWKKTRGATATNQKEVWRVSWQKNPRIVGSILIFKHCEVNETVWIT